MYIVVPDIICISGHAGSGKETVARILEKQLKAKGRTVLVTHYADLLKFMLVEFFDWDGLKDESGRTLLQMVGTDLVRTKDQDYWVRFLADCIGFFGERWEFVLIPDTRFRNEISYWDKRGYTAKHLRVIRPDYHTQLTDEQYNHVSETELDNEPADFYVINDCSLEELSERLASVAKEVIDERER